MSILQLIIWVIFLITLITLINGLITDDLTYFLGSFIFIIIIALINGFITNDFTNLFCSIIFYGTFITFISNDELFKLCDNIVYLLFDHDGRNTYSLIYSIIITAFIYGICKYLWITIWIASTILILLICAFLINNYDKDDDFTLGKLYTKNKRKFCKIVESLIKMRIKTAHKKLFKYSIPKVYYDGFLKIKITGIGSHFFKILYNSPAILEKIAIKYKKKIEKLENNYITSYKDIIISVANSIEYIIIPNSITKIRSYAFAINEVQELKKLNTIDVPQLNYEELGLYDPNSSDYFIQKDAFLNVPEINYEGKSKLIDCGAIKINKYSE